MGIFTQILISWYLDLGRHFCSGRYLGPDGHLDPSKHFCPGGYNGPLGISTYVGTLAQKGTLTWVAGRSLAPVGYLDLAGYLHQLGVLTLCGKLLNLAGHLSLTGVSAQVGHLGPVRYPGPAGHFVLMGSQSGVCSLTDLSIPSSSCSTWPWGSPDVQNTLTL